MVFHFRLHLSREKNFKASHLRYASKTYNQYQVVVKLLGSFRLAAGNRHLHRYCIFTELFSETVAQIITLFNASELHYSLRSHHDANIQIGTNDTNKMRTLDFREAWTISSSLAYARDACV
jgi:hypothetical protein